MRYDPTNKPYIHPLSKPKPQPAKTVKVKAHSRTVKPRTFRGNTPVYTYPGFGTTPDSSPTPSAGPPVDPSKALLDAAVRLRFGGQEAGINNQLAANARFSSGVPAWYQQAIGEIKGIAANGAAQNANTLAHVQNYNSPAAATGTPDAAQAANARNNLNAQFAAQLGGNAQANQDFMSRMQAGMLTQRGNTQNAANRDRQTLLSEQTALKGQKGDYRQGLVADQQAQQAKADLDDRKLQATLAIAGGKLDLAQKILTDVTKPNAAVTRKTKIKNANTQAATQQETAGQHKIDNAIKVNKLALDAFTKAHPELSSKGRKGKPAFTGTQKRKAASNFRTLSASLDDNAVHKDPNGAVNALVKGKKTDPVVANAIVESIRNHGSVTRETAVLYYRATGHHLHVSPNAKKIPGDLGKVVSGFLNGLGN